MIEVKGISKIYKSGKKTVKALNNVSFNIEKNSFTLIKGPSGCGKSTLLFTIGGMLNPTEGEVRLYGKNLYSLTENIRRKEICSNIGFVFQSYHLLPYLSVIDNIKIQNKLPFIKINDEYIMDLIETLQLKDRLNHKPSQLSIGEKQRVAMIRSLASKPELILADEPTGNLDPENAGIVLSFLEKFQSEGGTVLMVSHSSDADNIGSRIIKLKQGRIIAN